MEIPKKARIESLKQEVKDLHPILKTLFKNIPGVKAVEYTHGQDEFGADFILRKEDEILNSMFYVGVVVKIGRIEQGDVQEIKRQVNECYYPKLVDSGKQEIIVSEVWVVTNQHISHHAKIGIRHEFTGKKIEFIPGDRLIELIDKYFPSYWTDVTLELGQYLYSLRARNEEIEQSISLTNMTRDIYIDQELVRSDTERYELHKNKPRPKPRIDIHNLIKHQSAILVEGEMGSGKSKLIRKLIDHYTTPQVYLEQLLCPIYVSYRDLLDVYQCDYQKLIRNFVGEKAQKEIPANAKYLILVDGIDEKNLSVEKQLEVLNSLVDKCNKAENIKLLLTSRYLGTIEKDSLTKEITRLELLPLSPSKLLEFVKKICLKANISNRIFEDIKRSPLFRDLPKSPIAAILLSNIINNNSQELPSNLPELYSKYLELTLGRWDMEKGLQSQKEYDTLNSLMMELAKLTIEDEMPFLTITEVKNVFESYTKQRPAGATSDRIFSLMKERCSITNIDEKQGRFIFKHRTFAEYLYAQYLIKKKRFIIDNRAFSPYWENTFYFGIGALRDCPDELKSLIALNPESDVERFLKIVNMSNYFMAAYQTPYEVIEKGIVAITLEAAKFYKELVLHRVQSDLESLSEMHLLCLFQMVMRFGYSYSFFSNAIERAAIEVANAKIEDDEKAYALFFLNVIFIQMQKKSSFDWLLKDYAKILPLSIQLGISHEGENLKERTALMRRHDRALRSSIKTSKQLSGTLEKLYGRPVRSLRATRLK